MTNTVKQRKSENLDQWLERVAKTLRNHARFITADIGGGPLCADCITSGHAYNTTAEMMLAPCYNCGYGK